MCSSSSWHLKQVTFYRMMYTGVSGVKVKIFATSMDTPGRADLLGMQACNSYTACCVCKHSFRPGIGSAKKLIFDGYRRFLDPTSRGRGTRVSYRGNSYEYYRICERAPPEVRTEEFVRNAVAFARLRKAAFLGHKAAPLISRWPGFDWYRMNPPDFMHGMCVLIHQLIFIVVLISIHLVIVLDCKIFCEMLLKVMIGKGLGVHDDLQGGYKWDKDAVHRRESQALNVFRDIWPDRNGPLPWRITRPQLKRLNQRMSRIVWPHYMDRLFYDGCSFWIKPGRIWKTKRKVRLL